MIPTDDKGDGNKQNIAYGINLLGTHKNPGRPIGKTDLNITIQ